MVTKPEFMKALEDLPEGATIQDAIEHLLYLQAIEEGLADEEAGRLIPHEEALDQIKSWLK